MMMNSNLDVVNNLSELESFNPSSVHDFLLSLSANDQGFPDHQRSQIPFSFSNNITDLPSNLDYSSSSTQLHAQLPLFNHFDSFSSYFPQEGGPPTFHGLDSTANIIPSSESDNLTGSYPGFLLANKANENDNFVGKKRKRSNDKEPQKPKEVVHVRAKRGQATDSHSLAERCDFVLLIDRKLRREKINEKLRCLQDLVPGCYKTMGMAVMLDVIINYVRSLQNQIDFLSMKLSTASLYYDFNNSEMDAMGTMQDMHGFEAQGMEKMMGEGYGVLPSQSHTGNWPI